MKFSKDENAIIENNMKKLAISREEAEELFLFDKEEIDNEEADNLTQAIEVKKKVRKGSSLDKVKNLKAKKKIDAVKQTIVNAVFDFVKNSNLVDAPQEMTGTKISFKDKLGNYYSVTVTKHKSRPNGYKES